MEEKVEKLFLANSEINSIYNKSNLESKIENCEFDKKEKYKYVDITIFPKSINTLISFAEDEEITEAPATRVYHENKTLIENSSIQDRIVEHFNFQLKGNYRNEGLAKTIHKNELIIYKANDIKEIHLTSASDGVLVWLFLGYIFINEEEKLDFIEKINMGIRAYFREILKIKKNIPKISNLEDIKSIKHKLCPKNKMWFTQWFQKNMVETFQMYKKVI